MTPETFHEYMELQKKEILAENNAKNFWLWTAEHEGIGRRGTKSELSVFWITMWAEAFRKRYGSIL